MVILFFYIRGRVFTKDRGGSFFGALMGWYFRMIFAQFAKITGQNRGKRCGFLRWSKSLKSTKFSTTWGENQCFWDQKIQVSMLPKARPPVGRVVTQRTSPGLERKKPMGFWEISRKNWATKFILRSFGFHKIWMLRKKPPKSCWRWPFLKVHRLEVVNLCVAPILQVKTCQFLM